jgi:O-6-methylguanine DNA methyltransferase
MDKIFKTYYNSPIGIIEISGTEKAISSIVFCEDIQEDEVIPDVILECKSQLEEYFLGKRKNFSVEIILAGTEFQKKVWESLKSIPYGNTVSYKHIAEEIGNSKAVRAVGTTNSKNKLGIIVPCHRVIGSDGNLTGFAWGMWRKEWLINHEKKFL